MVASDVHMGINCSIDALDSDSDAEKINTSEVVSDVSTKSMTVGKSQGTGPEVCTRLNGLSNGNGTGIDGRTVQYDCVEQLETAARKRNPAITLSSPECLTVQIHAFTGRTSEQLKIPKSRSLRSSSKNVTHSSPKAFFEAADRDLEEATTTYNKLRASLKDHEDALSFENDCRLSASPLEIKANAKLQYLRNDDVERFYKTAPSREGFQGQEHPRFYGDHFLSNFDLIEQTQLFSLFRAMPKGAHLHIHFNANLLPNFLLDIAKDMARMYIWCNMPLVDEKGQVYRKALDQCRLQFSIMNKQAVEDRGEGSIFDPAYENKKVMQFGKFRDEFRQRHDEEDVDKWLQNKLVFQEEEAHGLLQTADGAWEKFNARTQMMKGLFNYKRAYQMYTRHCLDEFADDNIQYAEIRVNFMSTNQVWEDDGSKKLDNEGITDLIIEEYEKFQMGHKGDVVKGLKIIYCTPRSFNTEQVEESLCECLDFKLKEKYSSYIAGFDLVGEEGKGHPLHYFTKQLLRFQKACQLAGTQIPLLLHCGETLDNGGETDRNLLDALLLGSRRIGHGFALPRHPLIMEQMKKHNICVEVCPISNEILGLTPRISGHSVYNLLANNVHCTVSTDNGTLFRSRLSHDFYQVMAGKADMTLYGLRQLIEWSLEHSCMDSRERKQVFDAWLVMWEEFCQEIVDGKFDKPREQQDRKAALGVFGNEEKTEAMPGP
ncbi:putative adenosine deaminase-related growth factor [Triangularia verruculosa]|uniref:adenosine deaminase n=1 Tax=Triangularia verruculosa TaxID=2587418 RepID=A0AAN6XHU2_9PEZI|nr:putative adenosine deaminase-related growth factor [Triangularia verruculosa]